jgi:hypothetical protein
MSTFRSGDSQLRQCPYDPNHRVSITRFAGHVVKCAQSQKTSALLVCPFFASHRIRRADFVQHVTEQCEYMDKSQLQSVLRKFQNEETAAPVLQPERPAGPTPVTIDPITGEENWD